VMVSGTAAVLAVGIAGGAGCASAGLTANSERL